MSSLFQVNYHSGELQTKNGGGFPRRTTVVSFRSRTKAWAIDREQVMSG